MRLPGVRRRKRRDLRPKTLKSLRLHLLQGARRVSTRASLAANGGGLDSAIAPWPSERNLRPHNTSGVVSIELSG